MNGSSIKYPRGGIYRIDYLELLLCMALSHIIIGNPFFGAGVFLFADMVKAYFLCNILKLRHGDGAKYFSNLIRSLALLLGVAVAFLYPILTGQNSAIMVSLFTIVLILRDYFCSVPIGENVRNVKWYISSALIQLIFSAFCVLIIYRAISERELAFMVGGLVVSGIFKILFPEKRLPSDSPTLMNKYESIASYKVFADMNLYSTIAINLAIMVAVLLTVMPDKEVFVEKTYWNILIWFALITAILVFLIWALPKRKPSFGLAQFTLGAITWVIGAEHMFKTTTPVGLIVWTVVWGVGITLIVYAIRQFYLDFEAVGKIEGLSGDNLEVSNSMIATYSSIISSLIIFELMVLLTYAPNLNGSWIIHLPLIFMIVAIGFALKQPLDYRNREKLMRYIDTADENERIKDSLRSLFVKKYRMRFGVKILCTLARPFLRLKVSGLENLRKGDYPSVFVCNHGFIYGPISAVIYLPTYFRPWIHNAMLQKESAIKEMNLTMGKHVPKWLIRMISGGVCWALNSFNPIPVVRGATHDVGSTFDESLKALEEGDNILIFPEKPKRMTSQTGVTTRNFFTGFASIGQLYHEKTGKNLLFYPLYSDRNHRAFRIGEPVEYNPELTSIESKRAIAHEIQQRMDALARP